MQQILASQTKISNKNWGAGGGAWSMLEVGNVSRSFTSSFIYAQCQKPIRAIKENVRMPNT